MTPSEQFDHDEVKRDVQARVREGVKVVLEEVLEEEMTEHLDAGYRELTSTRRGERNLGQGSRLPRVPENMLPDTL